MRDIDLLEMQEAAVEDTGKWQEGKCETCGGPMMWRWTGLRLVASTGDETLAGKEIRTTVPPAKPTTKIHVWTHGDRAAGIDGDGLTIDWPGCWMSTTEDREKLREALKRFFGEMMDDSPRVMFDDEMYERGQA